uniref:Uncharacterized protein n=1 Tax=Haemonchus contortus TaxID=6289 RepID=A0A7I4YKM7_HAECO|nr:unnamed protein product [Haemonchus contortus]
MSMKLVILLITVSLVASATVEVNYEKAGGKDVSTTSNKEAVVSAPSETMRRFGGPPSPHAGWRKNSIWGSKN